jgi:hypothetical protein
MSARLSPINAWLAIPRVTVHAFICEHRHVKNGYVILSLDDEKWGVINELD